MNLVVINSSSKGNGYALVSSTETLLLEAGCRLASFKKSLKYHYPPVIGVLVSHIHGDHCGHINQYKTLGMPILAGEDVVKTYGSDVDHILKEGKTYLVGQFSITPFSVFHDVPTFGYLIRHPEMGSLLFATDTFALPYVFKNVNHWLIEANYDDEILKGNLKSGVVDYTQYKRILTSHMSFNNTLKNLTDGDADKSQTITLIHLSARNSNAKMFKKTVEETYGVPCYIAQRGLEVNLSKL